MADNYTVLDGNGDPVTVAAKDKAGIYYTKRFTEDGDDLTIGSTTDIPAADDTGTYTLISLFKRLLSKIKPVATDITTGIVSVTTSNGIIVAANPDRRSVTIVNEGTIDVRIGDVLLVGVKGAAITIETTAAITASAVSSTSISFIEVHD